MAKRSNSKSHWPEMEALLGFDDEWEKACAEIQRQTLEAMREWNEATRKMLKDWDVVAASLPPMIP